mgnify:CR=1
MKKPSLARRLEPPTLGQFKEFVREIISVPKTEIDKTEEKYQKERKIQKQMRPAYSNRKS